MGGFEMHGIEVDRSSESMRASEWMTFIPHALPTHCFSNRITNLNRIHHSKSAGTNQMERLEVVEVKREGIFDVSATSTHFRS